MKPYYEHAGITIYHADNRECLEHIGKHDLLLTDPPYGIGKANGTNGGGFDGKTRSYRRRPKFYSGSWDNSRPLTETFVQMLTMTNSAVIWGGNYFADQLPASNRWLVWDKIQPMPTFSDCEIAWTNLKGNASRMFRCCCSGTLCGGDERTHATQKPVSLMRWCLAFFPDAASMLDPFCGSGASLVAAKAMGLTATGIETEERYCEIAAKRLSQEVLFADEPLIPPIASIPLQFEELLSEEDIDG